MTNRFKNDNTVNKERLQIRISDKKLVKQIRTILETSNYESLAQFTTHLVEIGLPIYLESDEYKKSKEEKEKKLIKEKEEKRIQEKNKAIIGLMALIEKDK